MGLKRGGPGSFDRRTVGIDQRRRRLGWCAAVPKEMPSRVADDLLRGPNGTRLDCARDGACKPKRTKSRRVVVNCLDQNSVALPATRRKRCVFHKAHTGDYGHTMLLVTGMRWSGWGNPAALASGTSPATWTTTRTRLCASLGCDGARPRWAHLHPSDDLRRWSKWGKGHNRTPRRMRRLAGPAVPTSQR